MLITRSISPADIPYCRCHCVGPEHPGRHPELPAQCEELAPRLRARSCSIAAMDGVVLVLNQNYEPLNVTNLPRAFRLVFGAKAEVIEYDHQMIRTPRTEYRAPSVIRLQHQIRRPRPRVKLTRREVFTRDRYTCQYCGHSGHDLTLDHVVPRHRGGAHTWDNLVTACKACNHRKGGRTPDEARLRLHRPPFEPRNDVYSMFTPYLTDERNEAWRTYLFLGRN
jgi:5-methylcytosine-specific restriction endonuclease McrA